MSLLNREEPSLLSNTRRKVKAARKKNIALFDSSFDKNAKVGGYYFIHREERAELLFISSLFLLIIFDTKKTVRCFTPLMVAPLLIEYTNSHRYYYCLLPSARCCSSTTRATTTPRRRRKKAAHYYHHLLRDGVAVVSLEVVVLPPLSEDD